MIRACLLEKSIPVYDDGSHMRDWLYVADHCAAIDVVLRPGRMGDAYNIGGSSNWKNLDIVHEICHVLAALIGAPEEKFSRLIRFVKDRPGHDWRYAIDATMIQTELGWHPTETFTTGIRKTVIRYLNCLLYTSDAADE